MRAPLREVELSAQPSIVQAATSRKRNAVADMILIRAPRKPMLVQSCRRACAHVHCGQTDARIARRKGAERSVPASMGQYAHARGAR